MQHERKIVIWFPIMLFGLLFAAIILRALLLG